MTCRANPITWQLPAVLICYLCRMAFTPFPWTQTKTASAAHLLFGSAAILCGSAFSPLATDLRPSPGRSDEDPLLYVPAFRPICPCPRAAPAQSASG